MGKILTKQWVLGCRNILHFFLCLFSYLCEAYALFLQWESILRYNNNFYRYIRVTITGKFMALNALFFPSPNEN